MNTDGWHADPRDDAEMTSALEEVLSFARDIFLTLENGRKKYENLVDVI